MRRRILRVVSAVLVALQVVICLMPAKASAAERWLWPVPDSTNRSRGFSDWDSYADPPGPHCAQDITGSTNMKIVASRSGTVIKVLHGDETNWVGYGNGVVIDHGDGYYSHYAHMNYTSVTAGESVKRGQKLGGMGMTGVATGVHLHFAIKTNMYGGSSGSINNDPGQINYDYGNIYDKTPPTCSGFRVGEINALPRQHSVGCGICSRQTCKDLLVCSCIVCACILIHIII